MITTISREIQHIDNDFEVFNSIEVNLEEILTDEFIQELSSDINSSL